MYCKTGRMNCLRMRTLDMDEIINILRMEEVTQSTADLLERETDDGYYPEGIQEEGQQEERRHGGNNKLDQGITTNDDDDDDGRWRTLCLACGPQAHACI